MISWEQKLKRKAKRKISRVGYSDYRDSMTKADGESDKEFDQRERAVQLLYESITRLVEPWSARIGRNDFYMVGVFWRLMEAINIVDSRLDGTAGYKDPEKLRKELYPRLPSGRWISVDEEMPEDFSTVLVTIEYKDESGRMCKVTDFDTFSGGEWAICPEEYPDGSGRVTHWQPFPLPAMLQGDAV